jgi:tetratricopeptide (TPR) repeat protein
VVHKTGALHFHHATELNSKFPEAHNNLGTALKDLGTLEEAALNFRKALSIRPDFPQAVKSLRAVMRQLRHSVESKTTGGSSCGGQQAKEQEKPGRRFFKISERDFSSVVFDIQELETYVQHIKRAKWTKFSWKGLTLMKDPVTLTIYLQLIMASSLVL